MDAQATVITAAGEVSPAAATTSSSATARAASTNW